MIDKKYLAGFLDSDGSIQLQPQKTTDGQGFYLWPAVSFSQKTFRNGVLEDVAKEFNLTVHESTRNIGMSELRVSGEKGRRLLEQVYKHLVIKDDLARYILDIEKRRYSQEEVDAIRKVVNSLRRKDVPTHNFPSRRWMAGYIDGDGCIQAYVDKSGRFSARLDIATWIEAKAGISLICKAFGGYIIDVRNSSHLRINLSPTKVRELYDYFGKHLRIKKTQMKLVTDYIGTNKHSKRNGATSESNQEFCEMLATTKSNDVR